MGFAEKISANQAAEDIDFLIFALSRGYGGRKYVPGDSFSQAITALKGISKPTTHMLDDLSAPRKHLASGHFFRGEDQLPC